jgi:hypothetical protein
MTQQEIVDWFYANGVGSIAADEAPYIYSQYGGPTDELGQLGALQGALGSYQQRANSGGPRSQGGYSTDENDPAQGNAPARYDSNNSGRLGPVGPEYIRYDNAHRPIPRSWDLSAPPDQRRDFDERNGLLDQPNLWSTRTLSGVDAPGAGSPQSTVAPAASTIGPGMTLDGLMQHAGRNEDELPPLYSDPLGPLEGGPTPLPPGQVLPREREWPWNPLEPQYAY